MKEKMYLKLNFLQRLPKLIKSIFFILLKLLLFINTKIAEMSDNSVF